MYEREKRERVGWKAKVRMWKEKGGMEREGEREGEGKGERKEEREGEGRI